MPHTYSAIFCHIVFATKNREPLLSSHIRDPLYAYMAGIARNEGSLLLLAGGTADHTHLLVRFSLDTVPADFVRSIKANSSRWIHETYPTLQNFAWQRGYAMFGVDSESRDEVYNYIAHQEEHHRVTTFVEEFESMLKENRIEHDPRYLFL